MTFRKASWSLIVNIPSTRRLSKNIGHFSEPIPSVLAKHEGLLVGSSSGAALQGALNLKAQLSEGTIVVVFPDGSDLYSRPLCVHRELISFSYS
jgi:hypothetical protein